MRTYRNIIIAASLLLFGSLTLSAQDNLAPRDRSQYSLYFCTTCANGYCSDYYDSFTISSSGSFIYFVVFAPNGQTLNCHEVQYYINKISDDENYDEEDDWSDQQNVSPGWTSCYCKETFYKPGKYGIHVYTDYGYVTYATITVNYR